MEEDLKLKLYKISSCDVEHISQWPEDFMGFKLILYKPKIFERAKYNTSYLRNVILCLISKGQYELLLLYDGNIKVHSKGTIGKTFRYPYMNKVDLHGQQAFTNSLYQRKGIFTSILKLIPSVLKPDFHEMWVYCDILNVASQKAIERAGYKFVSYAVMNRYTKIVRMVDKL